MANWQEFETTGDYVKLMVDLEQLDSIKEIFSNTHIHLKSGASYILNVSYAEFKEKNLVPYDNR